MLASYYEGNRTFSVKEKTVDAPQEDEIQIRVAYCGVCGTDMHIFHGNMDQRVAKPLTIGHEMSGTVSAIGKNVNGYEIGDKVVVRPLDDRGEQPSDKGFSHICKDLKFIGIDSPGAMQQYWNVPDFTVHKLPISTDLKLAALIEPLAVACHDVRLSKLKKGEFAVVLGGGPIGMLVALVARAHGAEVMVSEVNPVRLSFAEKMGFETINPSKADVIKIIEQKTGGKLADVVFEVAGVQATVSLMTEIAGIRGRIVMVAIHSALKEVNLFKFFWKELQLIGARVYERVDYDEAINLVASGEIDFEQMITKIESLKHIQSVFEDIDSNPDGMKVLLDCQN